MTNDIGNYVNNVSCRYNVGCISNIQCRRRYASKLSIMFRSEINADQAINRGRRRPPDGEDLVPGAQVVGIQVRL